MRRVNVTEFQKNLSHYIDLCSTEDIQITSSDEVVAVLSNPDKQSCQTFAELCGCLQEADTGENYDEIIGEEILKKCGF